MSSRETARDIIADTSPDPIESSASVMGDKIPYLFSGDSERSALLVHGSGASRADWLGVMPKFSGEYIVYAPDLIGFGDAPRREFAHTPEYMADYLVGFMDAVGIERAALVGHSLGGRVCIEVALRHPERVTGMALEAPMGFGKLSWQGRTFSLGRWCLHKAMGLKSPYPLLDFPVTETDPTKFKSITCETMLLWGTRDMYFRSEQGIVALNQIPNSRLKVYAGVGHSIHRSIPSRFSSDVKMFLDEMC